jgi:hypothetical protein
LPTTVGTVEPSLSAVGVAMRDPTKAQLRLLCVPTLSIPSIEIGVRVD